MEEIIATPKNHTAAVVATDTTPQLNFNAVGGLHCECMRLYDEELRLSIPCILLLARTSIEVEDKSKAYKLALFDAI